MNPDAHPDPYLWASVLGAHAFIGVALWLLCRRLGPGRAVWGAVALYTLWEGVSAAIWGLLLWDSLLDLLAVTAGALTAASLWLHSPRMAWRVVLTTAAITLAGVWQRRR